MVFCPKPPAPQGWLPTCAAVAQGFRSPVRPAHHENSQAKPSKTRELSPLALFFQLDLIAQSAQSAHSNVTPIRARCKSATGSRRSNPSLTLRDLTFGVSRVCYPSTQLKGYVGSSRSMAS